VTENTPSARDVVHSGENIGISKRLIAVNMGWTQVKQNNLTAYLVVLVIVESMISTCARMMATAVGCIKVFFIFEDPFSEEWTEKMDQNFKQVQQSLIISSRYVTSLLI
jgi:hypothetical protein